MPPRSAFATLLASVCLLGGCAHNHVMEVEANRLTGTPTDLDNVSYYVVGVHDTSVSRGGELHLHGWIYGIHDGLLRDLGPHLSSVEERDQLPSIDHRVTMNVEPVSGMRRHALSAFEVLPGEHGADCRCDGQMGGGLS